MQQKKYIENRLVEEAKKMKCYKTPKVVLSFAISLLKTLILVYLVVLIFIYKMLRNVFLASPKKISHNYNESLYEAQT